MRIKEIKLSDVTIEGRSAPVISSCSLETQLDEKVKIPQLKSYVKKMIYKSS